MLFPPFSRFQGKRARLSVYLVATMLGAFLALAFLTTLVAGLIVLLSAAYSSGNILPGVVVQSTGGNRLAVGNQSPAAAATQLETMSIDRTITFQDGDRSWQVTGAAFGIKVDGEATAQKAVQIGRTGNGFIDDLGSLLGQEEISPVYTIDLAKATNALKTISANADIPAQPSAPGRTLNIGATLDALPGNVNTLLNAGSAKLVMDKVEAPQVTQGVAQGPRTDYTVQRGEELGLIAKKFNVSMSDIVALNQISDPNQLYPGEVLTIPAAGVWVPTEKDAPPAPLASGKGIVVSLSNQRIYAYQDGHLVHSALMSSGTAGNETVLGDYHIYVKYVSTRMTGPGYDLPDVPWTMYFYEGYGIHGAYWHNDFGRQMSHGCVNLETSEAKWFYDFAPVGTLVRVIQNWTSV